MTIIILTRIAIDALSRPMVLMIEFAFRFSIGQACRWAEVKTITAFRHLSIHFDPSGVDYSMFRCTTIVKQ